jgi:hypothetical protein
MTKKNENKFAFSQIQRGSEATTGIHLFISNFINKIIKRKKLKDLLFQDYFNKLLKI